MLAGRLRRHEPDHRASHDGPAASPSTGGVLGSANDVLRAEDGQRVRIASNVICRQRPGTAKGFVFISLEVETGIANAIVASDLFEELRLTITQEAYLLIEGRVQVAEGTVHVKANGVEGLTRDVTSHAGSHDFY